MPRTSGLQKVALIVGAILFTLATIELGLRAAGWAYLRSQSRQNDASLAKGGTVRILCLGESTTGLGGGSSYPRQLDRILNRGGRDVTFTVVNEGLSGTTTEGILERLDGLLDRYDPQIVVTMMGINDTWWWALSHDAGIGLPSVLTPLRSLRLFKLITLAAEHVRSARQPAEHCADVDRPDYLLTDEPLMHAFRLAGSGEFDAAYAIIGSRLAERPADLRALALLRIVNFREARGQFEPAMSHAETLLIARLRAGPDDTATRRDLGWLYLLWDKLEDAAAVLPAIEDPGVDCIRLDVARSLRATASRLVRTAKPAEAVAALERAIAALPTRAPDERAQIAGQLARARRLAGDAAGADAAELASAELAWSASSERTRENYHRLKASLDRRGIRLVAVQYPNRPVGPLRDMLDDAPDVVFVDNEQLFRLAQRNQSYDALFVDDFAGDFGHLTPAGNALLARNIAWTMQAAHAFGDMPSPRQAASR